MSTILTIVRLARGEIDPGFDLAGYAEITITCRRGSILSMRRESSICTNMHTTEGK